MVSSFCDVPPSSWELFWVSHRYCALWYSCVYIVRDGPVGRVSASDPRGPAFSPGLRRCASSYRNLKTFLSRLKVRCLPEKRKIEYGRVVVCLTGNHGSVLNRKARKIVFFTYCMYVFLSI